MLCLHMIIFSWPYHVEKANVIPVYDVPELYV